MYVTITLRINKMKYKNSVSEQWIVLAVILNLSLYVCIKF